MHSLHTVINLPKGQEDSMLYLAAPMHDIGKPDCRCKGKRAEDANMHYYSHPQRSAEIVRDEILPGLEKHSMGISGENAKRLLYYIGYHDEQVSFRLKSLKRHLNMVPFEAFQKLMLHQAADAKAHVQIPAIAGRVEVCSQLAGEKGIELYQQILNGE